jgi:hypothetical protein
MSTDRWKGRQIDRKKYRRETDGQMERQVDGEKDGWMRRFIDLHSEQSMDLQADE